MTNQYYQDGMQWFNMMRLLRQRTFENLNKTQTQFIDFLQRPGQMQAKINEFCDNFNRFSEEYPQLRENQ